MDKKLGVSIFKITMLDCTDVHKVSFLLFICSQWKSSTEVSTKTPAYGGECDKRQSGRLLEFINIFVD